MNKGEQQANKVANLAMSYFQHCIHKQKKKPFYKDQNGKMIRRPMTVEERLGILKYLCEHSGVDFTLMRTILKADQIRDYKDDINQAKNTIIQKALERNFKVAKKARHRARV